MSAMARIRRLGDTVNALSIRERALLLLVVFAVIFLIWDMTVMRPLTERQEQVQQRLEEVRQRVSALTTSIQQLATERAVDPNAELRARHATLNEEIDELQSRISRLHGGIAASRESIGILAGLLADRSGITVQSLENLPAEPLRSTAGEPVPGIYVHRVRVVLESDFAGVGEYLERVAELPTGVFWESMTLDVPEWPANRVELVLYSLAFSDTWLGV